MKWLKECDNKRCSFELEEVAGNSFSYCTHCYKVEQKPCDNHVLRYAKWPQGNGYRIMQQCITCGQTQGTAVKQSKLNCSVDELHYGEPLRQLYEKAVNEKRKELYERSNNENAIERRNRYEMALSSPHWKYIRQKVLKRDNHICQACLDAKAEEVHHLHYENLGNETALELVSVCKTCHEKIHA